MKSLYIGILERERYLTIEKYGEYNAQNARGH